MNSGKIFASLVVLAFINSSTHAQDFVKVEPKDIGLSAERLQRIGSTLEQAAGKSEISGAVVLLARHGEIGYLNAVGLSNLEAKSSMRPNTIL